MRACWTHNRGRRRCPMVRLADLGPKPLPLGRRSSILLLKHGNVMLIKGFVERTVRIALWRAGIIHSVVNQVIFDFEEAGNNLVFIIPNRRTECVLLLEAVASSRAFCILRDTLLRKGKYCS